MGNINNIPKTDSYIYNILGYINYGACRREELINLTVDDIERKDFIYFFQQNEEHYITFF